MGIELATVFSGIIQFITLRGKKSKMMEKRGKSQWEGGGEMKLRILLG